MLQISKSLPGVRVSKVFLFRPHRSLKLQKAAVQGGSATSDRQAKGVQNPNTAALGTNHFHDFSIFQTENADTEEDKQKKLCFSKKGRLAMERTKTTQKSRQNEYTSAFLALHLHDLPNSEAWHEVMAPRKQRLLSLVLYYPFPRRFVKVEERTERWSIKVVICAHLPGIKCVL